MKNAVITGKYLRRKNFPNPARGVKAKKFIKLPVTEDFQEKPDPRSDGRFQAVCEGKLVMH